MTILIIFLILTGICLLIALRKKQFFYLLIPVATLTVYLLVEIALVPAPFFETIKFIFSLS